MTLTNEDLLAISQLLDVKFKVELQPMKDDIRELKTDVTKLKTDVEVLKTDVTNLKSQQERINIIIENEMRSNIKLLCENYVPAAKKYEKSVFRIEAIETDVDILKKVVTEHSGKLKMIS